MGWASAHPISTVLNVSSVTSKIGIIAILLLIGIQEQVLAACEPLQPDAGYIADNHVYTSQSAAETACFAAYSSSCLYNSGAGWFYYYYVSPGVQHFYAYGCTVSCPDTNNNGTPDACESCPSQSGYKSNILGVITYCGNTVTQCNGQSSTSYEWGFSSDNCTPTQEPDCHVTSDCKKDLNQDGIADGSEGGGTYSGNPKADLDGDGIPDTKDCDFDFDEDGNKNCEDPCPLKSNPGTSICPDPCAGATKDCKDDDGDGIPDCACSFAPPCWECSDQDGDGIPNGTDPDPDGDGNPGGGGGGESDVLEVGGCRVDISSLRAWLQGENSFPFNFIYALKQIFSPLFELSPEAPVFDLEISLDPKSKYSWIPDTFPIHFDFTPFDSLAALLRWSEIIGLCIALVYYGIKRQRSFAATGG